MIQAQPAWTMLEPLRLRLAERLHATAQSMRGETWFVLRDPLNGRNFRISEPAYIVLELLDGRRTLGEARLLAAARLRSRVPTETETATLVMQLQAADAIRGMPASSLDGLIRRAAAARQSSAFKWLTSPLSVRLPLVNPDRFLERTKWIGRLLYSRFGFAIWSVCILWLALSIGSHWEALTTNVLDKVLAIDNALLMSLAFVLSKLVHEFGHALAVKRWNGEVSEMGISLLVFMPVPYVEASSSASFASKWQRIGVSCGGIYAEAMLAVLMMAAWITLEPGLAKTFALNTLIIASVSTVLFNANPLLRYDGYYVLSDLLEIPNLGTRSYKYVAYLFEKHVLRSPRPREVLIASGEGRWLFTYAIASFAYRAVIILFISFYLANNVMFIGPILAVIMVASFAILPIYKGMRFLTGSPTLAGARSRAIRNCALLIGAIALLAFALPVPMATRSEGVVGAAPGDDVVAGVDGVVTMVLAKSGDMVCRTCPVLVLDNPEVPTAIAALEARRGSLLARYAAERTEDLVKAQNTERELAHVDQRLEFERSKLAMLTIAAPKSGELRLSAETDLKHLFLKRGTVIGQVYRQDELIVRVIARQEDVGLIQSGTEQVRLKFPSNMANTYSGTIVRTVPLATDRLPSAALGGGAAGGAALDQQNAAAGPKALQRYFEIHVSVDRNGRTLRIGERAYVQFIHRREALGFQAFRRLRQLFLRELSL